MYMNEQSSILCCLKVEKSKQYGFKKYSFKKEYYKTTIMKTILVVGAGSFATEVEELLILTEYDNIAFIDDNIETARCKPVVGTMADIASLGDKYDTAIVALGNNANRMKYIEELEKSHYFIPSLIHPMAYVSKDAVLEPGCIIREFAIVGRYVHLKRGCIINAGAAVDHDCVLGEGTHCLIGAVVRNKKIISPMTWVPANCVIE